MKKFLRITSAELNRTISKPYTLFAVVFVIVLSFIALFVFSPTTNQSSNVYIKSSDYSTVLSSYSTTKEEYDTKIETVKDKFANVDKTDYLSSSINEIENISIQYSDLIKFIDENNFKDSSTKCSEIRQSLTDFQNNFRLGFENNIYFLFPADDYSSVFNLISNELQVLPRDSNITDSYFSMISNYVREANFIKKLTSCFKKVKCLKDIDKVCLSNTKIIDKVLSKLSSIDTLIVSGNLKVNALKSRIYDYVNLVDETCSIVDKEYKLFASESISDITIYRNFESFNKSISQTQTSNFQFLLNKDGLEIVDTLSSLEFNKNSGNETYAHDFIYYSIEIIKYLLFILVIAVIISVSAGEISNGSIRLTLIRPVKRSKVLSSKILACFLYATFILLITFIVNIVIGVTFFPTTNELMVCNFFGKSLLLSPIWVLLIYFANLLLSMIFVVIFGLFVSLIVKSNIFSLIISVFSVISSFVLHYFINADWAKWFPSININLFKYVINTSCSGIGQALSSPIISSSSLLFSIVYYVVFVLVLRIACSVIFNNKDM